MASLIFISFKFKKEIIFGLLFFLITISIVLQIFPVGQAHVAERYTYVPYIGLIFIVIQFSNYLKERNIQRFITLKPYLIVLSCIYGLSFSYLTWSRNQIWKDSTSLWKDVISKNAKSAYGYYSLANALYANGQLDEALKNYNISIELQPNYAESYYSRGTIKYKQMKYKDAINDFTIAIQLKPQYQEAFSNRGTAKLQLQDFLNAKLDFDKAIEINPNDPTEYYNRGNVEYYMQNDSLALKDLNKAIYMKPIYPEAFLNRGLVYYYMKNLNAACNDWKQSLDFGNKDALNYLNQFCK
jgi:tetratricopeptide (TPR) repeat protein